MRLASFDIMGWCGSKTLRNCWVGRVPASRCIP